MATLTLTLIRSMLRDNLNDTGTTTLSDAELNRLANDGYKDVCVKGVCYESKLTKSNIPAGVILVPLVGNNVIRVNYVAYDTGTGEKGMLPIAPQAIGANPMSGSTPQYWFRWGQYIVIEPAPDVATYDMYIYAACYPAAEMSADADTPTNLPPEFHECVYKYAKAYAKLKLRRWGAYAAEYNEYIGDVMERKYEYQMKHPDPRGASVIPDVVELTYA